MAKSRNQPSAFSRWRRRRRLVREGRQLTREARRILRKHRFRIDDEVAAQVTSAVEDLQAAMAQDKVEPIRDQLERLDGLVDKHLSFGRKSALREYTESIGIAVLVALFLRTFVVEAFKIPSGSMIPTLDVGDHIFVNKFLYGLRIPGTHLKFFELREPRRGEVVVFVFPGDQSKDFIKRIVAVGGDTVALRDNVVILNGKPVERHKLPGPCLYADVVEGSSHWEPKKCVAYNEVLDDVSYRVVQDLTSYGMDRDPIKVPEGHVFVMGDNRDNSHDSRFWGTVPLSEIKGKAMIIWWSSGEPEGIRWGRFFSGVHAAPPPKAPSLKK